MFNFMKKKKKLLVFTLVFILIIGLIISVYLITNYNFKNNTEIQKGNTPLNQIENIVEENTFNDFYNNLINSINEANSIETNTTEDEKLIKEKESTNTNNSTKVSKDTTKKDNNKKTNTKTTSNASKKTTTKDTKKETENKNTNTNSNTTKEKPKEETNKEILIKSQEAKEMFDLLNSFRKENNLQSLKWNSKLEEYAKTRAKEISKNFSHTRPDGSTIIEISIVYGENIGYTTSKNASAMFEKFKNSANHKKNLLNKEFKNVGIACVYLEEKGQYYWVQLFGK